MSGLVPKEVAALMGVIDTHCKFKSINERPRNYSVYHPSALGKCLRLMQYQRLAEDPDIKVLDLSKEPLESKKKRLFDLGHSVHHRWEGYWTQIGVLRGVWECANVLCRAFDDDGSFLGTDKIDEINANYKQMASESPEESYYISKEEGIKRSKLTPRKYGKKETLGVFKPESCNCGCSEFKYHEISVVNDELNIYGHADLILDFSNFDVDKYSAQKDSGPKYNLVDRTFDPNHLPKKPIVVDMKSVNSRGFVNAKKNGPSFVYEIQLKSYCNILDLEYGVLIYESKDDSDTLSFKIDRSEEVDWPIIERQIKLMNKMYEKKKLPPPRPLRKDSFDCKWCDFKEICHNSAIWKDPNLNEKRIKFYDKLA